ncbi:hypothetical protein A3F66_04090 [candidate division TM6 bacterium RIFCSPHIGHO2_12_FULL_32_22]|nr:MAG: hypothetical protein A3F66_04090 [candidate division TM6 bacterium RIFCSPHIGHO2_12_FULL_32_22]
MKYKVSLLFLTAFVLSKASDFSETQKMLIEVSDINKFSETACCALSLCCATNNAVRLCTEPISIKNGIGFSCLAYSLLRKINCSNCKCRRSRKMEICEV